LADVPKSEPFIAPVITSSARVKFSPSGTFAFVAVAIVAAISLIILRPVISAEQARDWTAYAQVADRFAANRQLYVWTLGGSSTA